MIASSPPLEIRPMTTSHGAEVLRIYQEGIDAGHATFESQAPSWLAFDAKYRPECRLVALASTRLLGWAAISSISPRKVYEGVAEVSVYVSEAAQGRGVDSALLDAVIACSEAAGIWTLQAGIFPENRASLALHERHGFRAYGTREKIGRMPLGPMAGQWRDVIRLERRSQLAGVD